MKTKMQLLKQVVFYSLFSILFLSSEMISGQTAGKKYVVTKLADATYVEEIVSKANLKTEYRILRETKAMMSDSLMKLTVARGANTEKLFGIPPGTLLKEIHFIADSNNSFFTNEKPSSIFVTTIDTKKYLYYESDDDYKKFLLLEKEEHIEHEIYHLLDYHLHFSDDSAMLNFMRKIELWGINEELFSLVYIKLPPYVCFDKEVLGKFLDKYPSLSITSSWKTEFSMERKELFAQGITTLDSFYWDDVMKKVKKEDPDLFKIYKEMLTVFKGSIERGLTKVANNPKDVQNVPIMILLKKRIEQLSKM